MESLDDFLSGTFSSVVKTNPSVGVGIVGLESMESNEVRVSVVVNAGIVVVVEEEEEMTGDR